MRRFIDFLYSPRFTDHRPLAFLRVGLCVLLVTLTITTWDDFLDLYGARGAIQRDISEVFIEDYVVTSYEITDVIQSALGTSEAESLFILRWIYLGCILLLGVGLLTRATAFLTWFLHLALAQSSHYMSYGVDYIHTILLFYCMIFPVGARYSVDALVFGKRQPNITPFLRLMQLHLCLIYLVGGIGKVVGPNWWNGESIWKSMHRPFTTSTQLTWMADVPLVPIVLGVGIIALELLYPATIWWKRTRSIWLWSIVAMHLGIALFLGLPLFSATMIVFNISAFYFCHARSQTPSPDAAGSRSRRTWRTLRTRRASSIEAPDKESAPVGAAA